MVVMINKKELCVVNDEEISTYENKGYETLITDIGFRNHPEYVDWKVFNNIDTIYPLTIIADRYSGVYSGGEYTAWPGDEEDIPDEVSMDGVTCAHEWGVIKSERQHVGIGCTPSVALVDLYLKQHFIFVEDYMFTVKNTDDGISITPLNERPILIDFTTARKIAKIVDSKAGAKADSDDENPDTEVEETETEETEETSDDGDNEDVEIEQPQLVFNCQYVQSTYVDDLAARYVRQFANDEVSLKDLVDDISVVAKLIANDIIDWNRSNGTDFEVIISEGERCNVEVRIVDIRHPKLTTTLYWRREWTYGYFSDNYLFKALQELTT